MVTDIAKVVVKTTTRSWPKHSN